MREKCTAQRGFTLIELLVVIAIIAILAAIIFPTFNLVREKTRQTTCMNQMNSIGQAVKLYYEDNHKYPSVLAANPYYSTGSPPVQILYDGGPNEVPLDIDQILARPLIKQRLTVPGKQTFYCPDNVPQPNPIAVTTAVYPPNVPLSGQVMSNGVPEWFYPSDSYDVGPALDVNNQAMAPYTYEVHYALDWTGSKNLATDPPNQLKYPNPPENSTVITWCTWHCAVNHAGIIPVLMLNGRVKAVQANQFTSKGPLQYVP